MQSKCCVGEHHQYPWATFWQFVLHAPFLVISLIQSVLAYRIHACFDCSKSDAQGDEIVLWIPSSSIVTVSVGAYSMRCGSGFWGNTLNYYSVNSPSAAATASSQYSTWTTVPVWSCLWPKHSRHYDFCIKVARQLVYFRFSLASQRHSEASFQWGKVSTWSLRLWEVLMGHWMFSSQRMSPEH